MALSYLYFVLFIIAHLVINTESKVIAILIMNPNILSKASSAAKFLGIRKVQFLVFFEMKHREYSCCFSRCNLNTTYFNSIIITFHFRVLVKVQFKS